MRKLMDFDLVVETLDDGYRTRVVDSPGGNAQASLVLPFTDKDLRILVLEVMASVGRVRRNVRRIETQDRQAVENFGGGLYQALFTGPVGDCLERSRVAADNRDRGLRIRLRLPGELANVPWEYLYEPQHGFLGLDPDTALVRYLELPSPAKPFPIQPPLRVLAVISAPSDLPPLDVELEWARLNGALQPLASQGLVKVDRLKDGRLATLPRALRLQEYHVLHFIGHGGYNEQAQDGALAMEDADGKSRLVSGRDLRMIVRHPSLRLVVLNACEGSMSAPDDPFSGVAQALARQGIPAVIAMQFEISDPAALAFSHSFYQAIADGLPVDVATVEARREMFADDNEIEWATPVLYLRSPDGRVFTRSKKPHQVPPDSDEPGRQKADPPAQDKTAAQTPEPSAQDKAQQTPDPSAQEEARRKAEQLAQEEARRKAEQLAQEKDVRVPVFGPLFLGLPLLILALKVLTPFSTLPKPWVLVVLCCAILGGVVAAVERQHLEIPVWTTALEFFFAWFLIYAIFKLNAGPIHRSGTHVPFLTVLAGIGAIGSAVLCQRALVRLPRKGGPPRKDGYLHPLLPVFLICMTVGLGAAAIGYASGHYSTVQSLQQIGPSCYNVAGVFLFAALAADLLAPLLALVRKLGRT